MRKPINTVQIENDASLVLKICTYIRTYVQSYQCLAEHSQVLWIRMWG